MWGCQESMASAILSLLAEDYRALVLAPETLYAQLQTMVFELIHVVKHMECSINIPLILQ